MLAHSGHGVNSYAIQYYLVHAGLRMFLFLGWGGVYMDEEACAAKIRSCFARADEVVAAHRDHRMTIVATDRGGGYWVPPGESERRETRDPLDALTAARDWLRYQKR